MNLYSKQSELAPPIWQNVDNNEFKLFYDGITNTMVSNNLDFLFFYQEQDGS